MYSLILIAVAREDKRFSSLGRCFACLLRGELLTLAATAGGGFNPQKPKKPKISLKSHFGCWVFWVFLGFLGFNWIFLSTFKKNVMKVFLPTVMLLVKKCKKTSWPQMIRNVEISTFHTFF